MPHGRETDARRFYADILGLTEVEKPASLKSHGGVWFRTGSIDLHLGVEEPFLPARKAHISYQVNDLESMAESLRRAGFPVKPDDRLPGFNRVYTEDSFGNRVEILTPQG